MTSAKQKPELKLVISIGANIPGILGDPIKTIATIRPQIEKIKLEWNVALNYSKVAYKNIGSICEMWYQVEPLILCMFTISPLWSSICLSLFECFSQIYKGDSLSKFPHNMCTPALPQD